MSALTKSIATLALSIATVAHALPCTAHDKWTGRDKTMHIIGGALFGGVVALLTDEPRAIAAGVLLAVAKEARDAPMPGHQCSAQDAIATLAGVALGTGLALAPGLVQVSYTWRF